MKGMIPAFRIGTDYSFSNVELSNWLAEKVNIQIVIIILRIFDHLVFFQNLGFWKKVVGKTLNIKIRPR
jgi:hypothetical protein